MYSSFSRPRSGGGRVYHARPTTQRRRNNNRRPKRGSVIDPSRFINKATPVEEVAPYQPQHEFADFALNPHLQRNLSERGYITPSPIQDQAIPVALEGRDVVGLANTGTGKTAAFVVPIIQRLSEKQARPAALIMAPTRELALQIDRQFRAFARGMRLFSALCVGGMNIRQQINELHRGVDVVIGTPGRLKDLVNRGVVDFSNVQVLVLDEADQMLDMGFIQDITFLIHQLPRERQSLCFSATMTPAVRSLLDNLLQDPAVISVQTGETSDHVEQDVVRVGKADKLEKLHSLLRQDEFEKVLIFGETKHGVQRLAEGLRNQGFAADAIHGNKTQPQRQRTLDAFKRNHLQVLVATDVAARGLHIPNVSHVINYDQPQTYQDYIHRIGRTGRGGQRGQALTFVEQY